jgi:hypothetical protein
MIFLLSSVVFIIIPFSWNPGRSSEKLVNFGFALSTLLLVLIQIDFILILGIYILSFVNCFDVTFEPC